MYEHEQICSSFLFVFWCNPMKDTQTSEHVVRVSQQFTALHFQEDVCCVCSIAYGNNAGNRKSTLRRSNCITVVVCVFDLFL